MLPKTQKNILITWLNLLRNFQEIISEEKADFTLMRTQWQEIQNYLQSHIIAIALEDFPLEKRTLGQIWQTETHRYIRLLNTELLFFYSAKQTQIKKTRLSAIQDKLEKMIQLTDNLT